MAGLTATADTNAVCTAFTPTIVYAACRLAVDIYGTAACPVELHILPFLSRKLSQQVSLVRFALEPPTVISSLEQ